MLILTRKLGESIVIDNNITVKVLSSQGNQIHLGIDAPRSVSIHRQEVYEQISKENKEAAHKDKSNKSMANIENTLSSLQDIFKQEK